LVGLYGSVVYDKLGCSEETLKINRLEEVMTKKNY
jgi:hypothetical protein